MTKIALITGAASGLGRATAAKLAADNWRIAGADLNLAGATGVIAGLPGQGHRAFAADARDEVAVAELFKAVEGEMGPVTALLCFAGGTTYTPDYHPRIIDTTLDEWLGTEAMNSRTAFLCVREYLRYRKRLPVPHGRIVLTASQAAQVGGGPTGAGYAAFKAAVLGLMKTAAQEGARAGITCNAISPGAIDTPALTRTNDQNRVEGMKKFIPVGRIGLPQEIAATAAFLCSEGAAFITGATIDVNGGSRMS